MHSIQKQILEVNWLVFTWRKTTWSESALEDEPIIVSYANAFWLTALTYRFTFWCWRHYSQPDKDRKEKACVKKKKKKSQASFTVSRQPSFPTGPPSEKEHWFSIIAWFPVTAFGNVFEFFKRSKEETISNGCISKQGKLLNSCLL